MGPLETRIRIVEVLADAIWNPLAANQLSLVRTYGLSTRVRIDDQPKSAWTVEGKNANVKLPTGKLTKSPKSANPSDGKSHKECRAHLKECDMIPLTACGC